MSAEKAKDIVEQVDVVEAIAGEVAATTPSIDCAPGESQAIADDGVLRKGKLAGLSMWAAIFVLSWPILTEAFMQSLVGIVDTMLAAELSEAATDAIGGAAYITWLLTIVGMAAGFGATAIVSRSVGKGRMAVADAAVGQTVVLSLAAGAIVGVATFIAAPEISRMLQLNEEAAPQLVTYLRLCSLGVPGVTLLTAGFACCRGAGDSTRPLITMAIVNVVNIAVSWLLSGVDIAVATKNAQAEIVRRVLIENPKVFELGITGIGIGTLCAWNLGAAIVIWFLVRGSSGVRLKARRLRPHWHTMMRLIRLGVPNFADTFGMWFGNFLTLLFVGWLREDGLLGAHIVGIRVEAFSFMPGFAMGMAAATLCGQYLGAGRADLARKAIWRCSFVAASLMGFAGLFFLFTPEPIVGLFTPQESHLRLAPRLLMIAGAVQIPFALMMVMRTAMRGAGDARMSLILTWVCTYAIRLPLAWLLSGAPIIMPPWLGGAVIANPSGSELGLVGLWLGLCTEVVIRFLFFYARFLHGGWARVKV